MQSILFHPGGVLAGVVGIAAITTTIVKLMDRASHKRQKIYEHCEETYVRKDNCALVNEQNKEEHTGLKDAIEKVGGKVDGLGAGINTLIGRSQHE